MILLTINGQDMELDIPPDTPLLWALRDYLNLTGTKYGCGIGECGACTVHVNGVATKSCTMSLSQASNLSVVTIEGLSEKGLHPVPVSYTHLTLPTICSV